MTTEEQDAKLKQVLTKLLPDVVYFDTFGDMRWAYNFEEAREDRDVLDAELLHLCAVVEKTLTEAEYEAYGKRIILEASSARFTQIEAARMTLSATWQQRATALAKVKGIEL